MKRRCMDLQASNFFKSIGPRFDDFKTKIKKYSKGCNIKFDEDVFMDTILCCAETCPEECCTDASIDNYFWVSYKQNVFNGENRNKFSMTEDISNVEDDFVYVPYNTDIDVIVDMIYDELENKFGKELADVWYLHERDGYDIYDLEAMGHDIIKLSNDFRKIRTYIDKLIERKGLLRTMLLDNNYHLQK